jgi:hypothetical protein
MTLEAVDDVGVGVGRVVVPVMNVCTTDRRSKLVDLVGLS